MCYGQWRRVLVKDHRQFEEDHEVDNPEKTTDADPIEAKKVDLHVSLATIKAIAEVV